MLFTCPSPMSQPAARKLGNPLQVQHQTRANLDKQEKTPMNQMELIRYSQIFRDIPNFCGQGNLLNFDKKRTWHQLLDDEGWRGHVGFWNVDMAMATCGTYWNIEISNASVQLKVSYLICLVVEPPLWKIWKSVGMSLPNIWKNKDMFQTTNQ